MVVPLPTYSKPQRAKLIKYSKIRHSAVPSTISTCNCINFFIIIRCRPVPGTYCTTEYTCKLTHVHKRSSTAVTSHPIIARNLNYTISRQSTIRRKMFIGKSQKSKLEFRAKNRNLLHWCKKQKPYNTISVKSKVQYWVQWYNENCVTIEQTSSFANYNEK